MTVVYSTPDVDLWSSDRPWVLICGGATRAGNRRARRTVAAAVHEGFDVIWLDGFEETLPDSSSRVPLDLTGEESVRVRVVGYAAAEEATFAGRLRKGEPWRRSRLGRLLWRLVLRRLGTVLRARAGWTVVRKDVRSLARRGVAPQAIVWCDDHAITTAWYAARLWRSSPVVTELANKTQ